MNRKQTKGQLILRFLKGSKAFFIISILATTVAAFSDMVTPQIIRAAIDNALGGESASYPAFVMRLVDGLGGFGYISGHLWILALAVIAVAVINAAARYVFRVYNTKGS